MQDDHPEFEKISQLIPLVKYRFSRAMFDGPVDPAGFFPDNPEYWTYDGSLTTPPLKETVTWIVFQEPIIFSNAQLVQLRGAIYQILA
jgi:carbonic anhydrase